MQNMAIGRLSGSGYVSPVSNRQNLQNVGGSSNSIVSDDTQYRDVISPPPVVESLTQTVQSVIKSDCYATFLDILFMTKGDVSRPEQSIKDVLNESIQQLRGADVDFLYSLMSDGVLAPEKLEKLEALFTHRSHSEVCQRMFSKKCLKYSIKYVENNFELLEYLSRFIKPTVPLKINVGEGNYLFFGDEHEVDFREITVSSQRGFEFETNAPAKYKFYLSTYQTLDDAEKGIGESISAKNMRMVSLMNREDECLGFRLFDKHVKELSHGDIYLIKKENSVYFATRSLHYQSIITNCSSKNFGFEIFLETIAYEYRHSRSHPLGSELMNSSEMPRKKRKIEEIEDLGRIRTIQGENSDGVGLSVNPQSVMFNRAVTPKELREIVHEIHDSSKGRSIFHSMTVYNYSIGVEHDIQELDEKFKNLLEQAYRDYRDGNPIFGIQLQVESKDDLSLVFSDGSTQEFSGPVTIDMVFDKVLEKEIMVEGVFNYLQQLSWKWGVEIDRSPVVVSLMNTISPYIRLRQSDFIRCNGVWRKLKNSKERLIPDFNEMTCSCRLVKEDFNLGECERRGSEIEKEADYSARMINQPGSRVFLLDNGAIARDTLFYPTLKNKGVELADLVSFKDGILYLFHVKRFMGNPSHAARDVMGQIQIADYWFRRDRGACINHIKNIIPNVNFKDDDVLDIQFVLGGMFGGVRPPVKTFNDFNSTGLKTAFIELYRKFRIGPHDLKICEIPAKTAKLSKKLNEQRSLS